MQAAAEVNECEERKQQNLCVRKEAAYLISKLLFLTYYLLCRFTTPAALPLFLHTYAHFFTLRQLILRQTQTSP